MPDGKNLRIDYFIDYGIWQEACKLLEAQIKYHKEGKRLYKSLPFFYYADLPKKKRQVVQSKEYFDKYIGPNVFYALQKEFFWQEFSFPKVGLGIRKYVFFSYPLLILYNAIGLYIFKLSDQLIKDIGRDNGQKMNAFYGGRICWHNNGIGTNYRKDLHYFDQYENFKSLIKAQKEYEDKSRDKVMVELDIQNYFENAKVDILLRNLDKYVKPSIKRKLNFDASTQEIIRFFFKFLNKGDAAIIQSQGNLISGFIGYLYLIFGDLIILEVFRKTDPKKKYIHDIKVIRYVDDSFLSVSFKGGFSKEEKKLFILRSLNKISQTYFKELNLRFNRKFGLYFLNNRKDVKKLNTRLRYVSFQQSLPESTRSDDEKIRVLINSIPRLKSKAKKISNPKKSWEIDNVKTKELFDLINHIKKNGISFLYKAFSGDIPEYRKEVGEVIKHVYNQRVERSLDNPKMKRKLEGLFKKFPYETFRLNSKAFTILIGKTDRAILNYRRYLLSLNEVTLYEAEMIHDYLTQIDFRDKEIKKKLQEHKEWAKLVSKAPLFPTKDYCGVSKNKLIVFENDLNIIEQTRFRRHYENLKEYTPALNHLLNEFHAICRMLDPEAGSGNHYNVNKVVKFLIAKRVSGKEIIQIRNLFDRRNKNPISHPGEGELVAWSVTKKEYFTYKKYVFRWIKALLSNKTKLHLQESNQGEIEKVGKIKFFQTE